MLIVRQAHGIGTQVLEQIEVLALIGIRDCPAFHRAILMHGRPFQEHVFTVQEKATIGIELDGTKAERLTDSIQDRPGIRTNRHYRMVQVRTLDAFPEPRMLDTQSRLHRDRSRRGDRLEGRRGDDTTDGVFYRELNRNAARNLQVIRNPARKLHARPRRIDAERVRIQAGAAEVQQIHMHGPRDNERHLSVDAAKDKEITGQWDDILGARAGLRTAIVSLHHQDIVA